MRKGFTLLELIVVIIIIGILATLGFTQYTLVIEKGRTSEARAILGTIRTAEEAYVMENGTTPASLSALSVSAPTSCTSTHYFYYSMAVPGGGRCGNVVGLYGWRCTSSGKTPNYSTQYAICVCPDSGVWMNDAPFN